MNDEQYKMNMDLAVAAARMCNLIPVADMLKIVDHVEDFGCFTMNPMDWQRGLPNLAAQRKLLNAIADVQAACHEIERSAK